jgi:hypothetical protein
MTTLGTDQLARRVHSVLMTETGFSRPLDEAACSILPGDLTEREQDLISWATTVGLAFELARMEDPCESLESVGKRAAEAAEDAYGGEYAGDCLARLKGGA